MSTEIVLVSGEPFTDGELQVFEKQYLAIMQSLSAMTKQKKALEEQEKKIKKQLEAVMDEYGIKAVDNQFLKITRVAGSSSNSIDLDMLKSKEPDLFNDLLVDYPKTTTRKASVRFDVK